MDANNQVTETRMTAKALFNKEEVKQKFQEMLGITGITAELNPGGFLPKEAVHRSLRLLTEEGIPAFK